MNGKRGKQRPTNKNKFDKNYDGVYKCRADEGFRLILPKGAQKKTAPTRLKDRAFTALNLNQYSQKNTIDYCGPLDLNTPIERQYILRMLVRRMFGEYKVPQELEWVRPLIEVADKNQKLIGIRQPFVYLTVRNGIVNTQSDDEWHVDGFSQMFTHLPEQNYVWSSAHPTEYVEKPFNFPADFSGIKHNVHKFFQNRINEEDVLKMVARRVYGLDPYIVHRRPARTNGISRCFVRLSYTPIEIEDINNTINPLLPTDYKRDGIKELRNKLLDYDNIEN